MRNKAIIFTLLLLLIAVQVVGLAQADEPVVRILFFFSPSCGHCEKIINEFMPPLMEKYGNQLEVAFIDISNPNNYAGLVQLERSYGIDPSQSGVPEIFIGDQVLTGEIEIQDNLETLIEGYLAQGGVDYPSGAQLRPAGTPQPTPTPAPTQIVKNVALAYFYKTGCQECSRVEYDLRFLESQYPNLRVDRFDVTSEAPLNEWLSERAGVPVNARLVTPSVFIGNDYLIGDDVTLGGITGLVEKYKNQGAPAAWDNWTAENPGAKESILDRFKSFGALTVAAAGLIDGLNPCAFATIVFFISYLAFTGRKGKDILLVGGAFALGVFLTYTLVGFGLLKAVQALPFMATLGRWVYLAAAALSLVLAIFSISDFLSARKGRVDDMRLRLPKAWRRTINRVIREGSQVGAFVAVAFGTGFVVSLIELACTGQVYLPTILFVMSTPEMRAQAVFYLLLYNVLFIMPLVTVFGLAYAGTSSQKLAVVMNKQTATVKLLTAVIFFVLAGWLLYSAV